MRRQSKPGPGQQDLFSALEPLVPPEGAVGQDAAIRPQAPSLKPQASNAAVPPQAPSLKPQASDAAVSPQAPSLQPQASDAAVPPQAPDLKPQALVRLAEIAVDNPVVRGTFTYLAEQFWEQLKPGARVVVPFGRRSAVGFFISLRSLEDLQREGVAPSKLKPILRLLDKPGEDPLLTPNLLSLARWMAKHYACPLGSTLNAMLPAGVRHGTSGARVRWVTPNCSVEELLRHAQELAATKPQHANLLRALVALDDRPSDATPSTLPPSPPTPLSVSASELLREADARPAALKALEKAGLVCIHLRAPARAAEQSGGAGDSGATAHDLVLNDEQQVALNAVQNALAQKTFAGFLLQGVTGSGKTEVYLQALKTALAQGRQGLVLVPEIALTPQTAHRFESRLGAQRVAVLHSHITPGERAEAWHAVRQGLIDVVIGARSALFAPLPRLGLIVVDEEQENAFKQESTPRYHARAVALELAKLSNAVLLLGSATPSFEAYHAARTGGLQHLLLKKRAAGRPLPPVQIVDLTVENRQANRFLYLAPQLGEALRRTLARREQAILFMNRRGWATVLTCPHCGYTEKCVQCDITLTSHRQSDTLCCHYCGFSKPIPRTCGNCQLGLLKHWGLGTERVEAEVRKLFPEARIARMDSDTMTRRTAYLEALSSFRAGRTDILVGTQMIAKGLDFPNVTLVGVVLADTALHVPDFRSRERTFQLLAQVAGRAGRGAKGGCVIVQTHLASDPAIRAAAQHDYETFALNELRERREFAYPPYTQLARIVIRAKDRAAAVNAAREVAAALRAEAAGMSPPPVVLGPAEAPVARIEGYHRQHLLLKAAGSEALSRLLNGPAGALTNKLKGAEAMVDVDPLSML